MWEKQTLSPGAVAELDHFQLLSGEARVNSPSAGWQPLLVTMRDFQR